MTDKRPFRRVIPDLQIDREPWIDDAACVGVDPDLFFPQRGASTREAKEVCRRCLAREACLEFAIRNGEKFGIWGGLSERERRRIRRERAVERLRATAERCANGHPWDDYRITPDGYKVCRYCMRDTMARRRRARGAPERGANAEGQELADVTQIRRPA